MFASVAMINAPRADTRRWPVVLELRGDPHLHIDLSRRDWRRAVSPGRQGRLSHGILIVAAHCYGHSHICFSLGQIAWLAGDPSTIFARKSPARINFTNLCWSDLTPRESTLMRNQRLRLRRRHTARTRKLRTDARRRIRVAELLESRVAPGSMIVDVLTLIGHPLTQDHQGEVATHQGQTAPTHSRSQEGLKRSVHDKFTRDINEPAGMRWTLQRDAVAQRQTLVARHGSAATSEQPTSQQRHLDRHEQSKPGASSLWFTESTGLVATGLDDGLEQPLSADGSTMRGGDTDRLASGSNSGSSSNQSPNPSLEAELAHEREIHRTNRTSGTTSIGATTGDSQTVGGALPTSPANRGGNFEYSTSSRDGAVASSLRATESPPAPASAATPDSAETSRHAPVTGTVQLGFADGLADWHVGEAGGSADRRGTVTEGSAILHEGDSFLVTLSTAVTIPEQPLSLTFTYEASFDTSDPDSINDAFEVALITATGAPLAYTFAPERDAFFNVTEDLPSALGRGTTETASATGNQVSLDISALAPGTQAVVVFRLVNNDADEDTTIHILSVQLTSSDDAPPVVTVGLINDTAPDGPGTDAYRNDLLTNDPRVSGTATDDDAITKLAVQVDGGPFADITVTLVNGQYRYDPGDLAPGSHRATVRATDTLSQTAESAIDFVVNTPPTADAGGNRTVNEGGTVMFDGSGSSDSDDALFGYVWGFHDGNFATEVASSHAYPQNGTFPVSLTVTDTAGSLSADQMQVFVANVAATIAAVDDKQANEGDIVSLQTTFVDPGVLDTHTATIDWGDGTSPEAGHIVEQSGLGTVSGMHQYSNDGQYTVTIQVTDSDEAESSAHFNVQVGNLPPTVVTATDLNGAVGVRLDFTATFSDPGVLDTHTAIVQWGPYWPTMPTPSVARTRFASR